MPYSVHWESRGLRVEFSGTITPQGMARVYDEVLADPRYYDARYIVCDFRKADEHVFEPGDLGALAELSAPAIGARYSNPYLVVAWITADESFRALGRDYAALGLYPVETFASPEDARAWLDERHTAPAVGPFAAPMHWAP
jgi:hypothetical protein